MSECDDAVVLSFDVTALSVQNLVVTFEHPYYASLVTGIFVSHCRYLLFHRMTDYSRTMLRAKVYTDVAE